MVLSVGTPQTTVTERGSQQAGAPAFQSLIAGSGTQAGATGAGQGTGGVTASIVAQAPGGSRNLHEARTGLQNLISDYQLGRLPQAPGQTLEMIRLGQTLHRMNEYSMDPAQARALTQAVDRLVHDARQPGADPARIGASIREVGAMASGAGGTGGAQAAATQGAQGTSGAQAAPAAGTPQTLGEAQERMSALVHATQLGRVNMPSLIPALGSMERRLGGLREMDLTADQSRTARELVGAIDAAARSQPPNVEGARRNLEQLAAMLPEGGSSTASPVGVRDVASPASTSGRTSTASLTEGLTFMHLGRGAENYFTAEPDALFEFRNGQDDTLARVRNFDASRLDPQQREQVRTALTEYAAIFAGASGPQGATALSREQIQAARGHLRTVNDVLDQASGTSTPPASPAPTPAPAPAPAAPAAPAAQAEVPSLTGGAVFKHLGRGAEVYFENEPDALFEFRESQASTLARLRDPAVLGLSPQQRETVTAAMRDYAAAFEGPGPAASPMSREAIAGARANLQQVNDILDAAGVPRP